MRKELWKMIPEYEGLYMVSDLGRVKSLNFNHTGEEKIMSPYKNKGRHYQVELWKDGKTTQPYVHVLVALAFIPNPENKSDVHHINFIPEDNRVENLIWLTKKEHHTLHKARPIEQWSKDGKKIAEYPSQQEAARQTGLSQGDISKVCNGVPNRKSVGGFIFKYKEAEVA